MNTGQDQVDRKRAELQALKSLALSALGAGELAKAARLTIELLLAEPTNVSHLALLRRIIKQSPAPFGLAPLANPMELEAAVCHAFILAEHERHADAIGLLLDTLAAAPGLPPWVWLMSWVSELKLEPGDQDTVLGALAPKLALVANTNEAQLGRAGLGPVLAVTRSLCQRAPANTELRLFEVTLLRRAKRHGEAATQAAELFAEAPSWRSAVALAAAAREAGDSQRALHSLTRACELEPNELSSYLDLGDLRLNLGDFREAIAAYSRARTLAPDNDWAEASRLLAEYFESSAEPALERLSELSEQGSERAAELIGLLFQPSWVKALPHPLDPEMLALSAAIEALKRHPPESTQQKPAQIRLELGQLGAPSLQLGFILGVTLLGHRARLALAIRRIPEPDPRLTDGQPLFSVWRFNGTTPQAAVPAPSDRIQPSVLAIAATPYNLFDWSELAQQHASELRPTDVGDLLACLVHIPLPSMAAGVQAVQPMDWVQRVQIAACLLIANLDHSWSGSVRKAALEALIAGPIDWTTNAAMVALYSIAVHEPEHEAEVVALYQRVQSRLPQDGSFSCVLHPLACLWGSLPSTPPYLRGRLWALRMRVEAAVRHAQAQHAG